MTRSDHLIRFEELESSSFDRLESAVNGTMTWALRLLSNSKEHSGEAPHSIAPLPLGEGRRRLGEGRPERCHRNLRASVISLAALLSIFLGTSAAQRRV